MGISTSVPAEPSGEEVSGVLADFGIDSLATLAVPEGVRRALGLMAGKIVQQDVRIGALTLAAARSQSEIRSLEADREALAARLESTEGSSQYDKLTGFKNYATMEMDLQSTIDELAAPNRRRGAARRPGLMMLDLDNFKPVNDMLGHKVGNLLLERIADALRASTREQLYRFGGDEIAAIVDGANNKKSMLTLTARLTEVIEDAAKGLAALGDDPEAAQLLYQLCRHSVRERMNVWSAMTLLKEVLGKVSASSGIVEITRDSTVDGVTVDADSLMYAVKEDKKKKASQTT